MANFGYTSMKAAMQSGKRVGNWRNTPVYACDSKKLPIMDDDVFYIVFDDENALVKDGKKYGRVTAQGDVRELDTPVAYAGFKREKTSYPHEINQRYEEVKKPEAAIPTQAAVAIGELDLSLAQIEKDIQDTLNGVMNKNIFAELDKFKYDY